jgi:heat shock protein HslJ
LSVVVDGNQIQLDDWPGSSLPWISFEPSVQGWTGCNSFSIYDQPEYTIADGVLTFGVVVIENAACEGQLAEVEAVLSGFLLDDRGITVSSDGPHMIWTGQTANTQVVFSASG